MDWLHYRPLIIDYDLRPDTNKYQLINIYVMCNLSVKAEALVKKQMLHLYMHISGKILAFQYKNSSLHTGLIGYSHRE